MKRSTLRVKRSKVKLHDAKQTFASMAEASFLIPSAHYRNISRMAEASFLIPSADYRKTSRIIRTLLTQCVSEKGCILYTSNKFLLKLPNSSQLRYVTLASLPFTYLFTVSLNNYTFFFKNLIMGSRLKIVILIVPTQQSSIYHLATFTQSRCVLYMRTRIFSVNSNDKLG